MIQCSEHSEVALDKYAGRIECGSVDVYLGRLEELEIETSDLGVTEIRCRRDGVTERPCGIMERIEALSVDVTESYNSISGWWHQDLVIGISDEDRTKFIDSADVCLSVVYSDCRGVCRLLGAELGLRFIELKTVNGVSSVRLAGTERKYSQVLVGLQSLP